MRYAVSTLMAVLLLLQGLDAEAGNHKSKGNKNHVGIGHCPPDWPKRTLPAYHLDKQKNIATVTTLTVITQS